MYAIRTLMLLVVTAAVPLLGGPIAHAGPFPEIPQEGARVPSNLERSVAQVIAIIPDEANRRIAEDLNGPESHRFYRSWEYMVESPRTLVLKGLALEGHPVSSQEDQTLVDELTGLLEFLVEPPLTQQMRYFHWAVVGKRYAMIVGVGNVRWIDLVEGPQKQVYVLARSKEGWQLLLSTNLKAFIHVDPPKVAVSDVLQPFIARSHEARHPTPPEPGKIMKRGKLIENPITVGLRIYNEEKCWACHRIDGAGGLLGPDLTHIGSRMPSIAWHLKHLTDPRSVQSRSIMPEYTHLDKASLKALASLLVSLK